MHFLLSLCVAVSLLVFTPKLFAADFSGTVVSVLGGDTIEVLQNQRVERIRLNYLGRCSNTTVHGE